MTLTAQLGTALSWPGNIALGTVVLVLASGSIGAVVGTVINVRGFSVSYRNRATPARATLSTFAHDTKSGLPR